MSDLIQNWLNNEIELSSTVTNIEKDFANGYLFGELLYKFNQQSNFKEFSKKNDVASNLANYCKLSPTLMNLKIAFDSRQIDAIMKEERGSALRLLYQMKMALEKVYPPTDIAVLRKSKLYHNIHIAGKMGDNQPALKIAHSRDKYDEHKQIFFQNRLQVLNKPQKVLSMEKHLQKFEQEKNRQSEIAQKYHKEELETKDKVRQETRRAQINKLQRNAGFMEEWQQKGVEDWKKNQSIKKDRERRQLEFEYKQADKYNQFTMKKIDEASKEVNDGIGQFEQTLKNIGINPRVKKEDAERAVSESLQNSPLKSSYKGSQRFASMTKQPLGIALNPLQAMTNLFQGSITLTSTGLKTKDKKTVTEQTRKERERRRRKMIVDQGKTHQDMEQKRKEKQIVERMQRQAKQEEELQYEAWRTQQCKQVIGENRKLREARYERRRELDQQTSIWREEEMMKGLQDQMDREMEMFKDRDSEMRIVSKQAKRERRNEVGQVLFDAIFDIANEAYIHQQKQDSEDIDPRNWHEWLQLFIDQLPIGSQNQAQVQQQDSQENEESPVVTTTEVIGQNLDQMELVDYLRNQGQWPVSLITDYPPNLEHFLTGQTDAAPAQAAKGAKAPAQSKQAVEQIQLEEGDTELPQQAPNNFLFGDALELIINLNFDARDKHKKPKVPSYLNLKLCFVGYSFAGKKTQAQMLREKLEGLINIYQLNDLVQEALTFYETHQEPIQYQEDQQQQEEQIQDDILDISADSEQAEQYNAEEDFRVCGESIANLLKEGQEINDELYVQLFIAKLRLTYPHKSKLQQRKELRQKVEKEREITQKIQALEVEIEELNNLSGDNIQGARRRRKRDPKVLGEELSKLQVELAKVQEVDKKGWILIDFPSTFAQAKLLETALSGYVPPQELDQIDREGQIEDAFLLVQPTGKEEPPKKLMRSGLDAVIWIDCSREECMRRALGRRFDPVNEKVYHIQDQPPLTTNAPLCERLVPMNEEDNSEAILIDKWISFDQHSKGLENWLRQFGLNSKKGEVNDFQILNKVNGDNDQAVLFDEIMTVVDKISHKKYKQELKIKKRILEKIISQEEAEAERIRKIQEEEEERKRKEQDIADGIIQPEEVKKEEVPSRVEKPEPATDRIGLRPAGEDNLDGDFKPTLMNLWQTLCSTYKLQMKKVFHLTRVQRERLIDHFSNLQSHFLNFLQRPDSLKQEKLDSFIRDFNDFSDQYPDLREDEQTKDELHQRVDILSDELWEIIEERKDQNVEERKKIMESGWIESEQGFAVQSAQMLMQSEVDKFKASVQLLHDYYHAFEDKLIPEAPQFFTQDLVPENDDSLPPVETLPEGADATNADLYLYPRLDKLFERALKTQVVPDVTQIQAAPTDKKGAQGKPGAKDAKGKVLEEEKPQEESQYVKEMKAAIKTEKALLRFRLTQIRNWSLRRLREMRAKAIKIYQKLEDWIMVSNKSENEAVEEMCTVIKRAIEEEKKIQDELRIKFMDFCVDEKIMNYIEPPPEKLPPLEEVKNDRFSILQLKTLIEEFEQIAKQHGSNQIPNKVIVDLFVRKLENSKSLGDEGSLPEDWKQYTEYDFQCMIRNLDKYNHGYIDWKALASFILLLKTPIPTDKQLDQYKAEFKSKDDLQTEGTFVNIKAWFDDTEYSKDRDYSIPFPRIKLLKQLLFRVHKQQKDEGEPVVSIKKYLKFLKSKELTMFKRNIKTYSDILIPPPNTNDQ